MIDKIKNNKFENNIKDFFNVVNNNINKSNDSTILSKVEKIETDEIPFKDFFDDVSHSIDNLIDKADDDLKFKSQDNLDFLEDYDSIKPSNYNLDINSIKTQRKKETSDKNDIIAKYIEKNNPELSLSSGSITSTTDENGNIFYYYINSFNNKKLLYSEKVDGSLVFYHGRHKADIVDKNGYVYEINCGYLDIPLEDGGWIRYEKTSSLDDSMMIDIDNIIIENNFIVETKGNISHRNNLEISSIYSNSIEYIYKDNKLVEIVENGKKFNSNGYLVEVDTSDDDFYEIIRNENNQVTEIKKRNKKNAIDASLNYTLSTFEYSEDEYIRTDYLNGLIRKKYYKDGYVYKIEKENHNIFDDYGYGYECEQFDKDGNLLCHTDKVKDCYVTNYNDGDKEVYYKNYDATSCYDSNNNLVKNIKKCSDNNGDTLTITVEYNLDGSIKSVFCDTDIPYTYDVDNNGNVFVHNKNITNIVCKNVEDYKNSEKYFMDFYH